MENRIIIPLLCAAALAYACGPWRHSSNGSENTTSASAHVQSQRTKNATSREGNSTKTTRTSQEPLATELSVTPTVNGNATRVDFVLQVLNNTRKTIELRFPNGKTHDFAVLDANGRTVWRWSDGRMFTQAMQNKAVKAKDTLVIQDGWDAKHAHGAYVAVATLHTDTHPIVTRTPFTLP